MQMVEDFVAKPLDHRFTPPVELGIGELRDPTTGDTNEVVVTRLADRCLVDGAPSVLERSFQDPRFLEEGDRSVDRRAADSIFTPAQASDELLGIEVGGAGQNGAQKGQAFRSQSEAPGAEESAKTLRGLAQNGQPFLGHFPSHRIVETEYQ